MRSPLLLQHSSDSLPHSYLYSAQHIPAYPDYSSPPSTAYSSSYSPLPSSFQSSPPPLSAPPSINSPCGLSSVSRPPPVSHRHGLSLTLSTEPGVIDRRVSEPSISLSLSPFTSGSSAYSPPTSSGPPSAYTSASHSPQYTTLSTQSRPLAIPRSSSQQSDSVYQGSPYDSASAYSSCPSSYPASWANTHPSITTTHSHHLPTKKEEGDDDGFVSASTSNGTPPFTMPFPSRPPPLDTSISSSISPYIDRSPVSSGSSYGGSIPRSSPVLHRNFIQPPLSQHYPSSLPSLPPLSAHYNTSPTSPISNYSLSPEFSSTQPAGTGVSGGGAGAGLAGSGARDGAGAGSQVQSAVTTTSKTYSFVPLPGNALKKRPRRRYDEIERLYNCQWPGCAKAYGTLNHLNAHVSMQRHGPKRSPSEFKELRKLWRRNKKEASATRSSSAAAEQMIPMTGLSSSDVPGSIPENPTSGNYSQASAMGYGLYDVMASRPSSNPPPIVPFNDTSLSAGAHFHGQGYNQQVASSVQAWERRHGDRERERERNREWDRDRSFSSSPEEQRRSSASSMSFGGLGSLPVTLPPTNQRSFSPHPATHPAFGSSAYPPIQRLPASSTLFTPLASHQGPGFQGQPSTQSASQQGYGMEWDRDKDRQKERDDRYRRS